MEGLKNLWNVIKWFLGKVFEFIKIDIEMPFHADAETAIKLMLKSGTQILVIIAIIIVTIYVYKKHIKREKF